MLVKGDNTTDVQYAPLQTCYILTTDLNGPLTTLNNESSQEFTKGNLHTKFLFHASNAWLLTVFYELGSHTRTHTITIA